MKQIRTTESVGHVLCHDITQILPGEKKGPAFRKGHIVTAEDIPVLLSLGREHLYVWEKQPGMLHENEAAEILYELCAGENMAPTAVSEGKIEVVAEADGVLTVDVERLRAVNALGEMMIATRHGYSPVKRGDRLAGTRVIPLVIEKEKMERAREAAGGTPLLALYRYRAKRVGIVTTGNEVVSGRIRDAFTPVLRGKVAEYGGEVMGHVVLGDDPEGITDAIRGMIGDGAEMVLCTGGMSVDPDDRTPLGIRRAADRVVSYGAPVLPGAMFMLAYAGEVPLLGLPGCVMYARRTIFDLVLPRLMADLPVTAGDLAALGHGGLCLNCETCIFPRCAFGAGV